MKASKQSKTASLKERLAFLEEAHRHTLDSLEIAASLGIPDGVKPLGSAQRILSETTLRLRKLLKFKTIGYFLIREPGGDLYLARCRPSSKADILEEQMRQLVDSGSAAWALQRNRPVFTSAHGGKEQLLLHSITTASRIRGIFVGSLDQDIKTITDTSLALLTIVLRGCASLLEGLELYGLLRRTNTDLKAKVKALEKSQSSLQNEIERRRKVEEELKHQALHDPLTGLPNRTLMLDRIQQSMNRAQRREELRYCVAFMDLDKFKLVNDTLGHNTGDRLLVRVGKRILETVRQMDTVARFGGDEFVIFLDDIVGPAEAVRVMKRVCRSLAEPFDIGGNKVSVTGSFGLAFGPKRKETPTSLINMANAAMHAAKESGRNRIRVYNSRMSGLTEERSALRAAMRRAVEKGRVSTLFTPIISEKGSELDGFEAIPVWRSKKWGELRGEDLMELAAGENLAITLWHSTLKKAVDHLLQWRSQGPGFDNLTITLSLSRSNLFPADLAQSVLSILGRGGLPGNSLRLDVPEESILAGGDSLRLQLMELKRHGVRLSLGNFGERFFAIHARKQTLFDSVRIDPSRIMHQPKRRQKELLSYLTSIAKALGLSVVADGINRRVAAEVLDGVDCLLLQKDRRSRPLTAEQAANYVRNMATGKGNRKKKS